MPHTSRKKRSSIPAQKRLQVTDDDGWTHVTSGSNVRRVMRTARGQVPREHPTPAQLDGATDIIEEEKYTEPELKPAEAPARLTSDEFRAQYATHREKWLASETWKILRSQLDERMRERMRIVSEGKGTEVGASTVGPVDAVVCIGLGSPSGFLRDGWVDRRTVSMYQLAALEAIKERLSCLFTRSIIESAFKTEKLTYSLPIRPRTNIIHPPLIPRLRPRPRLQRPRQEPPRNTRDNSRPKSKRFQLDNTQHTPLLPRRRTQAPRICAPVKSVSCLWRAFGRYRVKCPSGVCGEGGFKDIGTV